MDRISIASAARGVFYGGIIVPEGCVYGVIHARYNYTIDDKTGMTVKTLEKCKLPYYLTDFRPMYYAKRYDGARCAVFKIHVWNGSTWKITDTGASQEYYYLGEFLARELVKCGLIDKKVFGATVLRRETPGKLRSARPSGNKGKSAYGYMCKSPDRTMTTGDCVPDEYSMNRNVNWKKRGIK